MKKALLVLVSLVLILATQFAFADEEFTLHNGTKFGMNKDEVLKIESSKGFSVTYDSDFNCVLGTGTIANQADTKIYYYFKDGSGLSSMDYSFSNADSFDVIEKNITAKYGETEYSSDTLRELPVIASSKSGLTVPFSSYTYSVSDIVRDKYSQRFFEIGNGQYILIDHYVAIYKDIFTGEVDSRMHRLNYELLSDEEVEILRNGTNPSNDDL